MTEPAPNPYRNLPTFVPKAPMEWMDKANCKGMDPELFIPAAPFANEDRIPFPHPIAHKACSTCPVGPHGKKNICLSWAVIHKETGLWGGVTLHKGRSRQLLRPQVYNAMTPDAQDSVRHPEDD